MESLTKANVKALSRRIEAALTAELDGEGINVTMKGGRFNPEVGTFTPKVELSLVGAEVREFALNAPLIGLEPDDYGLVFKASDGLKYRLDGINLRRRKFPISAVSDHTGKRFKFTEAEVPRIREARS